MPETQLVVRIGIDGSVIAETRNVTGTACLDYIGLLEDVLQATTTESAYTADYTRSSTTAVEVVHDELGQS